jgi:hypothetical protein
LFNLILRFLSQFHPVSVLSEHFSENCQRCNLSSFWFLAAKFASNVF